MVVIVGYSAGLWGYCLVRGYCITPLDILSPSFPSRNAPVQSAQLV
jgi:hypothetical protein